MILTVNPWCGYLCTLDPDEGFVVEPDCPVHGGDRIPFRVVRFAGIWWCVGKMDISGARIPFMLGLS